MAARMRKHTPRGHGVGAAPHRARRTRDRAACRASIASEPARSATSCAVGGNQRDLTVTQEIAGGVVAFFVEFAAVTLPNMFMRNLVDILCDIMIFGLVIAVANMIEGTAARQISLGIAQEVEFSLPPSFTVYMTAAICCASPRYWSGTSRGW